MSNPFEPQQHDEGWADGNAAWHVPDAFHAPGYPETDPVAPTFAAPGFTGGPYPTAGYTPTAEVAPTKSPYARRRIVAASVVAGLVLAGGGLGLALHANDSTANTASPGNLIGSSPSAPSSTAGGSTAGGSTSGGSGSGSSTDPTDPTDPSSGSFGFGFGPSTGDGSGSQGGGGSQGGTGSGSTSTATATAAQQVGIVDINTTLGLESAKAAGTGMILTSNGEILTNNHVINGATSISVTVVATGNTYKATVVGYSATNDVAVLQLAGASGLQTVSTESTQPTVGQAVTGVGNAGGVGGTPSAAPGTVVALNQSITASDEGGGGSEKLTGLIETNAPIQAGDSGGPLFDSNNKVLGMDTAASSSGSTQAFAIPIAHALSLASQIEAGQGSSTVHIGETAFLGVEVQDQGGAEVAQVVSGSPAEAAGLAAGDIITAVNGTTVSTAASLSTALSPFGPGQRVTISWTDANGTAHHGTATLTSGPAQ